MATLLNVDWTPSAQILLPSSSHSVRHLRPRKFLLCTDSLSAIQGQQSPHFTHPFISELCISYHTLSKRDFRIALAWLPGHVGTGGNEAADAVARDATFQGALIPGILSFDFKRVPSVGVSWTNSNRTGATPVATDCDIWSSCTPVEVFLSLRPPWRGCGVIRLRVGHPRPIHRHLLSTNPPPVRVASVMWDSVSDKAC
jgi:hypothetical protein